MHGGDPGCQYDNCKKVVEIEEKGLLLNGAACYQLPVSRESYLLPAVSNQQSELLAFLVCR